MLSLSLSFSYSHAQLCVFKRDRGGARGIARFLADVVV